MPVSAKRDMDGNFVLVRSHLTPRTILTIPRSHIILAMAILATERLPRNYRNFRRLFGLERFF